MELKLWHTIVSACGEVRQMLDGKRPDITPEAQASDATIIVSHSVGKKDSLRSEISAKLDALHGELAKVLSERERYFVLFPLTIHYDELVLRRLPPNEQTAWPLLQNERFKIDDGGDKFFSFAEERLGNPDTPPLVFEVLYFCLSDGFMGRYASEPARIAGYKSTLAARIPMPKTPAQTKKSNPPSSQSGITKRTRAERTDRIDREAKTKDGKDLRPVRTENGVVKKGSGAAGHPTKKPSTLFVSLFYVAAAAVLLLMPLVLVWLSNL